MGQTPRQPRGTPGRGRKEIEMYTHKGREITKAFRRGYVYWRILGDTKKRLFTTLKAAKAAIDDEE